MASLSAQGYLTCIACRMVFSAAADQRAHYQSDLHRFNLRRQATNLPPVSAEVFHEKVQQQRAEEERLRDKHSFFCSVCNKSFGSENTYKQHNASRKHLDRARRDGIAASTGAPSGMIVVPEAVPEPEKSEQELIDEKIRNAVTVAPEQCLFCSLMSASLEANLSHMAYEHGFFLPHAEYIDDLSGLVEYLGEKLGTGNTCLSCNKMFKTFEGVQQHMVMSNHCRLKWDDNEDEYLDWYDWDKQLEPQHDDAAAGTTSTSTEAGASTDAATAATAATADAADVEAPKGPTMLASGYAMVLADGSMIGHRELASFYRQRFKREETRDSVLIQRLVSQYNTLGFVNPVGKFQTKTMKRTERRDQFWHNKRDMQLGVKANRFQPHRREQVIF